jgi:hypothetical protein
MENIAGAPWGTPVSPYPLNVVGFDEESRSPPIEDENPRRQIRRPRVGGFPSWALSVECGHEIDSADVSAQLNSHARGI